MIPTPTLKRRLVMLFEPLAWRFLVWSTKTWTNHYMDQWEKFRFKSSYGYDTFVTISYVDPYPMSFHNLDHPEQSYGPPPDIDKMAPS